MYADNDAINQSQQLLKVIQSALAGKPDAIAFEPAGSTGLPQVAKAAASAGIGWVILNREVDYLSQVRSAHKVPVFCITSDHKRNRTRAGRPDSSPGATRRMVLYIQGPSGSDAAQQRTDGMQQRKPENVQVRMVRAHWTELSAYQADRRRDLLIDFADPDHGRHHCTRRFHGNGRGKAFQEITDLEQRDRWLALPFTGCDGMPEKPGKPGCVAGALAATVIVPANAGLAFRNARQRLTEWNHAAGAYLHRCAVISTGRGSRQTRQRLRVEASVASKTKSRKATIEPAALKETEKK